MQPLTKGKGRKDRAIIRCGNKTGVSAWDSKTQNPDPTGEEFKWEKEIS